MAEIKKDLNCENNKEALNGVDICIYIYVNFNRALFWICCETTFVQVTQNFILDDQNLSTGIIDLGELKVPGELDFLLLDFSWIWVLLIGKIIFGC